LIYRGALDCCAKADVACSDIPLVIAAFLLWKFIKGTKFVSLAEIPIREALDEVLKHPEPLELEATGWKRIPAFLFD
jgi:amino acid transporter